MLDGFSRRSYVEPSCGNEPLNCSFEEGLTHWTIENNPYPNNANWSSTGMDAYAGRYSAMLFVNNTPTGNPKLIGSIVTIEPNTKYRLAFSTRVVQGNTNLGVGYVWFFGNNQFLVQEEPVNFLVPSGFPSGWLRLNYYYFTCPPTGAIGFQPYFKLNLVIEYPATRLLDEVTIESQSGTCP